MAWKYVEIGLDKYLHGGLFQIHYLTWGDIGQPAVHADADCNCAWIIGSLQVCRNHETFSGGFIIEQFDIGAVPDIRLAGKRFEYPFEISPAGRTTRRRLSHKLFESPSEISPAASFTVKFVCVTWGVKNLPLFLGFLEITSPRNS